MKLLLDEPESSQLYDYLGTSGFVSSDLSRTEVIRAVARRELALIPLAIETLHAASLIALKPAVLDSASRLGLLTLRSLDAIHLASALTIRDELEAFVAYDARLLEAAAALGLPIASPGAPEREAGRAGQSTHQSALLKSSVLSHRSTRRREFAYRDDL